MKKVFAVIASGILAITLVGCGVSDSSSSSTESTSSTETIEKVDLNNLKIGDTATFSNYSITVNNVEVDGSVVNVDVTMETVKESTFASRYMDAYTDTGKKVSANSLADMKIEADDTYRTLLTYPSTDITSLKWDNWNNEAVWKFELEVPENANVVATVDDDDLFYAWETVKSYGEHTYPYGFKLHYILDNQIEDNLYGDTWHLVASCDIRNEYGKWAKGLTCNAVVTGSGEDWTVDSFVIQ